MTQYVVTAPSGEKFKITAPDGATQEQALAYAKAQWAQTPEHARASRIEALKRSNPAEYDPSSKEFQAKHGPLGSNYENFMAGAGKAVVDIGRGVKQLGVDAGNLVGLVSDQTQAKLQTDIDASRERDAPLMKTGAGVTGNIAGNLAMMLIPAGAAASGAKALGATRTAAALGGFMNPQTLSGAALAGGVQGALQPVATSESRLLNAGVGAATGAAVTGATKLASKIARPVKSALTAADQRAVQTLDEAGVPLDAAQRTGSRFLQRMKNMLQDNPTTAGSQAVFREQQQRAYNRAVLATLGEQADAATPDVMTRASTRIGQVFDDIAERNPVKYSGALEMRLAAIEKAARDELDDAQFGVIRRQLNTILDKAAAGGNAIDGAAYQNMRTGLERIASGQDTAKGYYARQIRSALDQALEDSTSGVDANAIKIARGQWAKLKQIEPAIAADESGHISAAKLANTLSSKRYARFTKYGRGDQALTNLAKAGKQILPEPTANSGTPARLLAQFALPGALGIAGGLASDDPMTGVKLGVATYMLPKLMSGAIRPGPISSYLANGLGNPYVSAVLQAPQTQALIGAPLKRGATSAALALAAPE